MKENDNLEEIWKMIQEKYPLVHFTGSSRLYTMVRRMQTEKVWYPNRIKKWICDFGKIWKACQ